MISYEVPEDSGTTKTGSALDRFERACPASSGLVSRFNHMEETTEKPPLLKRPVKVLSQAPPVGQGAGDYYPHSFVCQNCYDPNHRWILKGTPVSDVASQIECASCGCSTT